jgi:hypothetical protein
MILFCISFADKLIKILLSLTSIQYAEAVLFLKLACIFLWLAGGFHNFDLTQNRKTRNDQMFIHFVLNPVRMQARIGPQCSLS